MLPPELVTVAEIVTVLPGSISSGEMKRLVTVNSAGTVGGAESAGSTKRALRQ